MAATGQGEPPGSTVPPKAGPTIIVRRFAASDLRELLRLESKAFGREAYDASAFEDLRQIDASFFVAVVSGAFAGYAVGWLPAHGGELVSLAVDPALRRRGLGRRLAFAVLDDLRRQGARSCRLQVRISNLGAIDFYSRLGFRVAGLWRDYYTDGESAYVMRTRLRAARARHRAR